MFARFAVSILIVFAVAFEWILGPVGEFRLLRLIPTWDSEQGWGWANTVSLEDPWYLLLLLIIPLIEFVRGRRIRHTGTMRFPNVQALLDPRGMFFARMAQIPDFLRLIALTLFILAFARPQTPDTEILTGEGVDIVIALDMSQSMNAVDLPRAELENTLSRGDTPKNRFEIAREILQDFVKSRGTRREDRVGLVIFGRNAFVKFPLTLDYGLILNLISPESLILDDGNVNRRTGRCSNDCTVSGAGTVIGDASGRAYQRLRKSAADSKVIVLITDGSNEGGTLQPEDIVEYIATQPDAQQIRIYTFLVGNDEETYQPLRVVTPFGEQMKYERVERFPTNPELLETIAEKTGGEFYKAFDESSFREHFASLTKTVFETERENKHKDIFIGFVLIGIFFLSLELLLRFTILRKFP